MAKHICLMSRTDKGKKCRQALIDLEKDWNSPEKVMARALKIAQNTILKLTDENAQQKQIIAEYSPKASYYDVVLQTPDALSSSQIAKDYGKSAKWLNQYLHDKGVQYNQGGVWLLYKSMQNRAILDLRPMCIAVMTVNNIANSTHTGRKRGGCLFMTYSNQTGYCH